MSGGVSQRSYSRPRFTHVFRDRGLATDGAGEQKKGVELLDEDSKEWQERLSRWSRETLRTCAAQRAESFDTLRALRG